MSKHYLMGLALVAGLMTFGAGTAHAEPATEVASERELSFHALGTVANEEVILAVDTTVDEPTTMTVYLFGCAGTEKPIVAALQRGDDELSVPLTTGNNTFDESMAVTAVFTDEEGNRETVTRSPNSDELKSMKSRLGDAMGCSEPAQDEKVIAKSEPEKPLVSKWSVKQKAKNKKLRVTATKVNYPAKVTYKWFVKGKLVTKGKARAYKPKRKGKVTVQIVVKGNGTTEARRIRMR